MHVHLQTYIIEKGIVSRHCMYVGSQTEEEVKKLPPPFVYDNRLQDSQHNKVMVWYVTSLEDHEREEIKKRKEAIQ